MSPTGLKSRCCQGSVSFWSFHGKIHFLAFSIIQGMPMFLAHGPPPSPAKITSWAFSDPSSITRFPSDHCWETFSISKDSCDETGPSLIIQNNLPFQGFLPLITSAKPLLLCKVTYSQVLEIRTWTSLGTIILPNTHYLPMYRNTLLCVILNIITHAHLLHLPNLLYFHLKHLFSCI